ncbi:MAG: ATP-binding cassette domain-containing protein [Phycisphaerales bacterium]|nr:ATP-binding cassette domain-containing protein [Phycisphaerales bacterium]
MNAIIEVNNVSKTYGETKAVSELNLSIPSGVLCGFLGPNGAGKSTTIRMMMSIIHPDSGYIQVLGTSALDAKDNIGYLPEERGVYRKMRVGTFIQYIANLKGIRGSQLKRDIDNWLDRVELPGVKKKKCEELSKGMQQKVQFIASIIHNPELIILDEPFSGLDPLNTQTIGSIIHELHQEGKTIIFSTHVLQQAEEICDRIVMIDKGHKVIDDDIAHVHEAHNPNLIQVVPLDLNIDFTSLPEVERQSLTKEEDAYHLKLTADADPVKLIQSIAGSTPIKGIEIVKPTLTEIFINKVAETEGQDAAKATREQLAHA